MKTADIFLSPDPSRALHCGHALFLTLLFAPLASANPLLPGFPPHCLSLLRLAHYVSLRFLISVPFFCPCSFFSLMSTCLLFMPSSLRALDCTSQWTLPVCIFGPDSSPELQATDKHFTCRFSATSKSVCLLGASWSSPPSLFLLCYTIFEEHWQQTNNPVWKLKSLSKFPLLHPQSVCHQILWLLSPKNHHMHPHLSIFSDMILVQILVQLHFSSAFAAS